MKKVFVTSKLPQNTVPELPDAWQTEFFDEPRAMHFEELLQRLRSSDYDALICTYKDQITAELIDAAGAQLKVISTLSTGVDHIDLAACKQAGIEVCNVADASSEAVSDSAIAILLVSLRRLDQYLKSSVTPEPEPWHYLCGLEGKALCHCRVGIIGMGRIGTQITKRLAGFGATISYYSRNQKPVIEERYQAQFCTLPELFSESDAIIVCCPLTEDTRHLINEDLLKHAKPGLALVNVARGGVCENEGIVRALSSGQLKVFATDATEPEPLPEEHPLRKHPDCLIFPHVATSTWDTRERIAQEAIAGVARKLGT